MDITEGLNILKKEKAIVNPHTTNLLKSLKGYNSEFDERFIQKIGEDIGFISSDDKV